MRWVITTMMNKEELLTKQQLLKRYRIDRHTYEDWVKNYDLPEIRVSSHKRYIRRKDLEDWEQRKMVKQQV